MAYLGKTAYEKFFASVSLISPVLGLLSPMVINLRLFQKCPLKPIHYIHGISTSRSRIRTPIVIIIITKKIFVPFTSDS